MVQDRCSACAGVALFVLQDNTMSVPAKLENGRLKNPMLSHTCPQLITCRTYPTLYAQAAASYSASVTSTTTITTTSSVASTATTVASAANATALAAAAAAAAGARPGAPPLRHARSRPRRCSRCCVRAAAWSLEIRLRASPHKLPGGLLALVAGAGGARR